MGTHLGVLWALLGIIALLPLSDWSTASGRHLRNQRMTFSLLGSQSGLNGSVCGKGVTVSGGFIGVVCVAPMGKRQYIGTVPGPNDLTPLSNTEARSVVAA